MPAQKKSSEPSATPQNFPIIGIGASAGGLDAFKQFLKAVPEDSGMAYVLVQHLDPSHESILPDILSRVTNIPVNEITDDIHLAPNHIYVIPANKILTSTDGVLKITPRNTLKTNMAIDVFFTSLAEVHQDLATGIVLSGNGTDGTQGLKAIRAYGGITFAQDQISAANGSMPQNAVDAGVVDFILAPKDMPEKLIEVFEKEQPRNQNDDESNYQDIILLLRHESGVDFTYYKQTTIRRRIARRMAISKSENLGDYLKFLRKDKTATRELFNDLLIPVTSFFRDPTIFLAIRENVLPALIKNISPDNSIRIWIAGCSTGEEAYTLAIALHEALGENLTGRQIRIFASDISEIAIAKARMGFYDKSQLHNVSDAVLKKYFTKEHNGYQVNRQIRDVCIFALHNFLKDPPFAKMDLITCRNVLIYMNIFLQRKALTTFHYALRENGFLLLGKSETTSQAEELFTPFDKTSKIYTRNNVSGRAVHQAMNEGNETASEIRKAAKPAETKTDFRKSAETILLSEYTPASVIINEHMDIVHIHGAITPFLEAPQGKPTFNLLKMANSGLAYGLRNALLKSRESGLPEIKEGIPVKTAGRKMEVTIEVVPLLDTTEIHYLVLFYRTLSYKEAQNGNLKLTTKEINNDENLKRIAQLEKELAQTHQDVHAITEDQEAFNEELQSANEELMSGSEELQSLNEELETSKEELQSSNEELITINQQLIEKQEIIEISKHYTEAIIATLREPIVLLDPDLRIKNINRAFAKKFSVTKLEAEGKLIYEIQNHLFDNPFTRTMLKEVLDDKTQLDDYEISVDLQPFGKRAMLLNARRVTNENINEQLIMLGIEDITERRKIELQIKEFSKELEIKVTERTKDLLKSNFELETSVRELHKANIQLEQFAYIASHDLQEPLRKILIFTSRLEEYHSKLPSNAITLLDKISLSSNRMSKLIQDLLEFSYLNHHDALFTETDLNVILNNILSDFELLIEQKKFMVKSDVLPVIKSIPLQMNQLFYNLVSNAIKFCCKDDKMPLLTITSRELPFDEVKKHKVLNPDITYCEIVFTDNGIGFEQQYEKRIFTIFQRLHNNDTYLGTGIGLAISKKIIENHSGEIFATAKPGAGAIFHVILPMPTV